MTTGPRLRRGGSLAPGLVAVALFATMATIVWNAGFAPMNEGGFPEGLTITAEIGYAMFGLEALQSGEGAIPETESFLAALLLIAVVLDAALDAALVLAKREDEGEPVAALASRPAGDAAGETGTAVADGGRGGETPRRAENAATDAPRDDGGADR